MPELISGPARQGMVALASGLRLNVVEWGAADGWPLVILHGGGHHSGCWAEVCRRLPPQLRCIVPDQRGHGSSDRSATGDYSCAAQTDDVVALLRELSIERCASPAAVRSRSAPWCWSTWAPRRAVRAWLAFLGAPRRGTHIRGLRPLTGPLRRRSGCPSIPG